MQLLIIIKIDSYEKKYFLTLIFLTLFSCSKIHNKKFLIKPKFNNPTLNAIVTSKKPLLSFFSSEKDNGKNKYIIQLDTKHTYNSPNVIEYKNKFIYGCQFHPEIKASYNEGKIFLSNFLKMVLKK